MSTTGTLISLVGEGQLDCRRLGMSATVPVFSFATKSRSVNHTTVGLNGEARVHT